MPESAPLSAAELARLRDEMAAVIQPERIIIRLLATIDALAAEVATLKEVVEAETRHAEGWRREYNEAFNQVATLTTERDQAREVATSHYLQLRALGVKDSEMLARETKGEQG